MQYSWHRLPVVNTSMPHRLPEFWSVVDGEPSPAILGHSTYAPILLHWVVHDPLMMNGKNAIADTVNSRHNAVKYKTVFHIQSKWEGNVIAHIWTQNRRPMARQNRRPMARRNRSPMARRLAETVELWRRSSYRSPIMSIMGESDHVM